MVRELRNVRRLRNGEGSFESVSKISLTVVYTFCAKSKTKGHLKFQKGNLFRLDGFII